jgi:integrase
VARTIRDAKLETRAARDRLKPGRKPHYKTLIPGKLHLGYRRKRKDEPGQWLVRHYLGGERYRVVSLGVADDFQDMGVQDIGERAGVLDFAEAQRRALASKADHDAPRRGGMTVAVAVTEYIAWLKVHRATGEEAERRAAKQILPQLGKIKIADLTTARLNRWRDALAETPALGRTKAGAPQNFLPEPAGPDGLRARRATTNRVVTILKAALNKAFNDGRVNDDTEWRRFKPFTKVSAARPGFLSLAEAGRLINAADPASGFRDLVRGALETGARYGELRALRVRDFHRGKIAIHQSKSGKPRDIVLTENGARFFAQLAAGRDGAAFMFERLEGGPWRKSMQARPCKEACVAAKIKPAIGFHQLRHTWASHAVMNGMPLMVVARNLGHASTAMVEKHYGHLATSYIDDQVRAAAPQFGVLEPTNVRTLR